MIARFAGPVAATELNGLNGLCTYITVWYLVKVLVSLYVCNINWKRSVDIWIFSPIFLILAGVVGFFFSTEYLAIVILVPLFIGIYESTYWTLFFAVKNHDLFDSFTDDAWQNSEILGTGLGLSFGYLLYFLFTNGGSGPPMLVGAIIAIMAIVG